jgi:hypothetical protein
MPASFMHSSDITLGIWNSTTNLDSWVNNVVASMTNVVRRTARMSQPVYNRAAYQLGVMVRWTWLILPLAMVILSILLLIVAIINTVRSPVAAWKGNLLVYLLFEVSGETRHNVHGKTNIYGDIEKAVGQKKPFFERLQEAFGSSKPSNHRRN